ncbi:chromosome condensation protein CrcB [Dietzia sp. UCD-THP]|uniref:fluoride efflux transporter FluC n=1 Tax=Dietzia sp. UCD-THP TaxID=1292020 RepID=UPI00036C6314|nr:CrcB family protein [Dietzia sp. UCD-THP]EYT62041.1 chromosome condensation protein CrcB [Dietzia sp. UCD-THP]
MTIALIALFGGLGAAARFVVDGLVRTRWSSGFPVGTVAINITGSLLMGFLTGAAIAGTIGGVGLEATTVGFCAGYTTFSTAMVETVRLVQGGDYRKALVNVVGTGIAVVAAVAAGLALATALL